MVRPAQTFIEIASFTIDKDGFRGIKGDPDGTLYAALQPYLSACAHNKGFSGNGVFDSTMFKVNDLAPRSAIDDLLNSHPEHKEWDFPNASLRGCWLRPGTPTDAEVDDLIQYLRDTYKIHQVSIDASLLDWSNHPLSSSVTQQDIIDFLKNEVPSLTIEDPNHAQMFDIRKWE